MKSIGLAAFLGFVGMASMAHAGLTSMSVADPTCSYTNFGFQNLGCANSGGNLIAATLPADGSGFSGVTFYLSGTDGNGFFQNNAGALTDIEDSPCGVGGCVTTITFSVSGASTGGGTLASGSTIGLAGDFNLAIDTASFGGAGSFMGDGEVPYTLSFDLVDNTQGNTDVFGGAQVLTGANAATNQMFQNALTLLTVNAGDTLTLMETLSVNWVYVTGSPGLIVTIPQGSFDFDATGSVPEPSTLSLLGPALAGALFLRLRRKNA
jgi:PEP-CTERM motif-containing protein